MTLKVRPLLIATTLAAFMLFSEAFSAQPSPSEYLPGSVLLLDPQFTHHILVAEKATHSLHLYQNQNGHPVFIKSYQMVTGKIAGDKSNQGDFKTPEGIYFLKDFIPRNELLKKYGKEGVIYGAGAFVMDYPNPIDRYLGKNGGGIWLHSTNDETRIEKGLDSRGCVVTANKDLVDLSQYIELEKTALIILHDLHFLTAESWKISRDELEGTVSNWAMSWQNEDIDKYIGFYDQHDFKDPVRGGYQSFKKYKAAVFSNPGKPTIGIKNLSILRLGKYAVANFKQVYNSSTINDQGRKTLYLRQDDTYHWKILYESFGNLPDKEKESDQFAFQPSMRFFGQETQKNN